MNKRGTIPTELFIRDTVKPVPGMPSVVITSEKLARAEGQCRVRLRVETTTPDMALAFQYRPAKPWLKNHHNRMQRRLDTLREEFQQRITGILHCAADEDAVIECCDHALKWLEKKP